jgi:pimeloyl-ACP methyl ester carboxylesterase
MSTMPSAVEVTLLPGVKHSPQREAPDATLKAITEYVARVLQAEAVKAA